MTPRRARPAHVDARPVIALSRLLRLRADHEKPIDRYIDYFGGHPTPGIVEASDLAHPSWSGVAHRTPPISVPPGGGPGQQ
jgi:hypothetical protein